MLNKIEKELLTNYPILKDSITNHFIYLKEIENDKTNFNISKEDYINNFFQNKEVKFKDLTDLGYHLIKKFKFFTSDLNQEISNLFKQKKITRRQYLDITDKIYEIYEDLKINNYFDFFNFTGIEHHLEGKWMDLIIKINKYVYTTASTNFPDDKNLLSPNPLFLYFVVPLSKAKIIKKEFEKIDNDYEIKISNESMIPDEFLKYFSHLLREKINLPIDSKIAKTFFNEDFKSIKDFDFESEWKTLSVEQKDKYYSLSKNDQNRYSNELENLEFEEALVEVSINDTNVERRDLYEKFLNFLEKTL